MMTMGGVTVTYTFRSPCSYCSTFVREDVEYSGPYDTEGHASSPLNRAPFRLPCR